MKESERVQTGSKDTEVKRDMEFKEPFNQTASSLCSPTSSLSPSSSLNQSEFVSAALSEKEFSQMLTKGLIR